MLTLHAMSLYVARRNGLMSVIIIASGRTNFYIGGAHFKCIADKSAVHLVPFKLIEL